MKCIDELKEIGAENIATKTRITQDKIQNIIDLKFETFNKAHARGFIQIIEREFGVDLGEWFDAYNEYHSAESALENGSNNEVAGNINIAIESDKKDKSYVVLIVLLIVLVACFMGFFIYNNFISADSLRGAKNANKSTITPSQEIKGQNAKDLAMEDSLQGAMDLTNQSADSSANTETNPNEAQNAPNISANLNANPNANQSTNQNANPGVSSQNVANLNIENPSISANQNANPSANPSPTPALQTRIATQSEELIITPNEPLWVGVIDLKTYRKKQLSTDSRYVITLDGDKLIRTGHSYFSVSSGANFAKQYIGGDNKYFLYRVEGGISEISKAEFLRLNKGQEW